MKQVDNSIQDAWDTHATHPLQSWAWGEFRKSSDIDIVRLNANTTAQTQISFHSIPHTPFTIGYLPKGPNPTKQMTEDLTKLGKQKRAIFIQLEPNMLSIGNSQLDNSQFLKPSHHPLFTKYTFILDLTKSEDELLKAMHPKTRYNIKVAQKHGVVVREDNSDEAFEAYLALTKETTDRQGFFAHNDSYHRSMWDHMKKAGIAHLWTATYSGKTLAAWIIFTWRHYMYYPYGTSSRDHREVMAPYLLLWEIARWGKAHNYKHFDLWGAIGPEPKESDPWYGFHKFKQGFNPALVEFIGSYDLVINPLLYQLYKIADTLRWFLLRMKKS